ncbi:MAG TPA: sulfite exporter TauE/SafE family protein [Alphaproteobacteria bacterium]|nr:sulfite exporter TauE/SafE family protein [Alphaproteobacteria bacterium]
MSITDVLTPELFDYRLAIAVAAAIGAGLMRGFAGFGSAMMLSPIYSILYGPPQMIVMILVMELFISLPLIPGALKHVEGRFVGALSVAAGLAMPFGSLILTTVDRITLTRAIAIIVLAFVALLWSGWRYKGRKRLPVTLALGAVSGAMCASTSMAGPPVLAYMLSGPDSAATNRANIIIYFAVIELFLGGVLAWRGLIHLDGAVLGALMMPIYTVAGHVGARQFRQSSEAIYRRLALGILTAIGLFGLLY